MLITNDSSLFIAPLSPLTRISTTPEQTRKAFKDWRYWVGMGYEFADI